MNYEPADAPSRGRTRDASTTATTATTTETANSAVNAPPATALATSAVRARATDAPSASPIDRAALLKPCDDTGERLSTATENRGYMKPIAPPAKVHATNAITGDSVNAATSSTTTRDAANSPAPI